MQVIAGNKGKNYTKSKSLAADLLRFRPLHVVPLVLSLAGWPWTPPTDLLESVTDRECTPVTSLYITNISVLEVPLTPTILLS